MSSDRDNSQVDRRLFLAASAAAGAVVMGASSAVASTRTAATAPKGGHASLGLAEGADLGEGWSLTSIARQAGACRLAARHEASGRDRHVLVCRHEDGAKAMASTGAADLFLVNDGERKRVLTPDDEVRLVRRLAAHLKGREGSLPGWRAMLGHGERQDHFRPIDDPAL